MEAQWEADGERCLTLSQSLASIHFQAIGERAEVVKPLLSHTRATDWGLQKEVLVFDLDTERIESFGGKHEIAQVTAQLQAQVKWLT